MPSMGTFSRKVSVVSGGASRKGSALKKSILVDHENPEKNTIPMVPEVLD